MHTRVTSILGVLLLAAMVTMGHAKRLFFANQLNETVWVGSQGNSGKPPIEGGGWEMKAYTRMTINVDDSWAGRFWGRTKCDDNGNCETGNCGGIKCSGRGGAPPATLAEFTFGGWRGQDYYDISLVDGFNLPITIEPTVSSKGSYRCAPIYCLGKVNENCPHELRLVVNGRIVGCKSACEAFRTDEFCCRGAHNRLETCKRTGYPLFFKQRCANSYSYAFDDYESTFTCENTAYEVSFGRRERNRGRG